MTTAPGSSPGTENAALQICLREGQSRAGSCCPGHCRWQRSQAAGTRCGTVGRAFWRHKKDLV